MKKKNKIYLGTDHAGFKLKEKVKKHLEMKGFEVKDFGAFKYDQDDDYPDFILPVARAVVKNNGVGIIFGSSGQGEAMTSNKIKGIRAALYYGGSSKIVKLSKEHGNSNILSLGARFVKEKEALKMIDLWLKTKFSEDKRHKRRLKKINKLGGR